MVWIYSGGGLCILTGRSSNARETQRLAAVKQAAQKPSPPAKRRRGRYDSPDRHTPVFAADKSAPEREIEEPKFARRIAAWDCPARKERRASHRSVARRSRTGSKANASGASANASPRLASLPKEHCILPAGDPVGEVEADICRFDGAAAHHDIAAITRIDAPVAIDHARAVEIARSQPGGRLGAINRLDRSENDIRICTFGKKGGKPARSSGFIVVKKRYPIPARVVEAGIAGD